MSKALYDVIGGKSRKVGKVYGVVPAAVGMSKNLLPVYELGKIRGEGVNCERNEDGSIHVYGTAAETNTCQWVILFPAERFQVPAGTYTLSMGSDVQSGVTVVFEYYDPTGTAWLGNYGNLSQWTQSRTVEIGDEHILSIYLGVSAGYSVDFTLYPQLEAGSEATEYVPYGEIIQSVARKIKKSYDVVGGRTKQFYSAEFLSYDGEYEVLQVEYEGKICDLYRLKKSGILTLNDDALFWMCGGGSDGGTGSPSSAASGGFGGGGGYILSGEIASGGNMVVTVGAGNCGRTSIIGDNVNCTTQAHATVPCKDGASGGGGTGPAAYNTSVYSAGTGTGESTVPFGIAELGQHCAGGGAGCAGSDASDSNRLTVHGGAGGSNGANGVKATLYANQNYQNINGGSGGTKGGGKGRGLNFGSGKPTFLDGSDATFYGSGGGGGSAAYASVMGGPAFSAAPYKGYQGVVYILDVNGGVAV